MVLPSGYPARKQMFYNQLKLNGENFGDPIAGTGAALSFGLHTANRNLHYFRHNGNCSAEMTGNTFVEYFRKPQAFAVTGGGAYCEGGDGVAIGLSGSQTNVLYQLKLNGENFGDALAGTGSALSFGLHTAIGTYTISATNGNCSAEMTGNTFVE